MPGHDLKVNGDYARLESLLCSHCELILEGAIQTENGIRFCTSCWDEIKSRSSNTVLKSSIKVQPTEQALPDIAVRREVDRLPVKCYNHQNGCPWTGKLKDHEKHQKHECTFKMELCKLGCGAKLVKDRLHHMDDECPLRQVKCPYCHSPLLGKDLENHLFSCLNAPFTCKRKRLRSEMDEHQLPKPIAVHGSSASASNYPSNQSTSVQRDVDSTGKSAKSAITTNVTDLTKVLSTCEPSLRTVVNACCEKQILTNDEAKHIFDHMTGKDLLARANILIDIIQTVVEYSPDLLDEFLCILQKKGDPSVRVVAGRIAQSFGKSLPQYEAVTAGTSNAERTIPTDNVKETIVYTDTQSDVGDSGCSEEYYSTPKKHRRIDENSEEHSTSSEINSSSMTPSSHDHSNTRRRKLRFSAQRYLKHTSPSETQLKIIRLEDIKQFLEKFQVHTIDWRSMGLSLGLYANTLSAIERNSNDVEECLYKALRAWLERSDDVDNKGGATWQSLTRALRDNDLIAVAESIEEKYLN